MTRTATTSLASAVLLGALLTGCSMDRWAKVAAGEYTPVRTAAASAPASEIEAVRVDRDNHTVWFVLTDGVQIIASFAPVAREEWPAGCPANINSTRMEVLEIAEETLTIGSTVIRRPVLVRSCPPDPVEIVVRNAGEIGGAGDACHGAEECIRFEPASGTTSLPRSMKGYELFSWRAAEEDGWRYTLVTGTNRWKSYAEIATSESVVTREGLVKITVRGTDALKSVLGLLPEGEVVTWIDVRRLEDGPAAREPYPDRTVVREIERQADRLGVDLEIAD